MQTSRIHHASKLLFVSLDFPFPATNGHRLRNWGLLRALAAEGHEVTLLTFVVAGEPSTEALDRVREVCREVVAVPLELPKSTSARGAALAVQALVSPVPFSVLRFRSDAMKTRLEAFLRHGRFDAVMCETCYPLINFPAQLPAPLILDNHNMEHVLVQRYSPFERNPAKRAYAELEWRRLQTWERASWKRAGLVIVCSAHDRALCAQLSGASASVVPNVVDVEEYRPDSKGDGSTLLYVGGMDWFPNRDAVAYFGFRVLPHLLGRFPKVKFVVAGRGPSESFRSQFDAEHVSFTGTLQDVRPALARADVCVVPLRIGSGTRLKILEAAAMGKAIVSTRIGAEGLNFVDRREILLADTESEMIDAASRLLADPEYAAGIGRAARERAEAEYSHAAMRSALGDAFTRLQGRLDGGPLGEEVGWSSSTF